MKQTGSICLMIVFASLMLPLFGCASKPGPLGEGTVKLDDFDFSTSISEILPERYIHSEYGNDWYQVPSVSGSNLYTKETRFDRSTKEDVWVEYSNVSYHTGDEYLSMAGQEFNAANFVTTLDGRIFLASGKNGDLTEEESDDFIARLSKRYGEPVHTVKSFAGDYDLYTWTLEDRTLKYAAVPTDENNVMVIEKVYGEDGSLADIREGKRRTILQGYFFVIDAEWKDRFLVTDRAVSGDFCYCK